MKRYVKASSDYNKYSNDTYKGQEYGIHCNEVNTDDSMELFNEFKAQVSEIHPYDEADYAWASLQKGVISYYRNRKLLTKEYYLDADDEDIKLTEWPDDIVFRAMKKLYELNKDVEPIGVYD